MGHEMILRGQNLDAWRERQRAFVWLGKARQDLPKGKSD